MQKVNLEQVRRNKTKNSQILIDEIGVSRNSFLVKVGGVGVEGVMMLEVVGAHV